MIYLYTQIDPVNSWYTHFLYKDGYIYKSYKMNKQLVIKQKLYIFGIYDNINDTIEVCAGKKHIDLDKNIIIDKNLLVFDKYNNNYNDIISTIKEHITRVVFENI